MLGVTPVMGWGLAVLGKSKYSRSRPFPFRCHQQHVPDCHLRGAGVWGRVEPPGPRDAPGPFSSAARRSLRVREMEMLMESPGGTGGTEPGGAGAGRGGGTWGGQYRALPPGGERG